MKVIKEHNGVVGIELTRRNLKALLAKLDGNPPNSACTLVDRTNAAYVKAVEDVEHYADRAPGALHEDTAKAL